MYESLGGPSSRLGTIPSGDRGTAETLKLMRQLAEQGSKDMAVRDTAIYVVGQAAAPGHDPIAQLAALFRFVRDRVLFIGDVYRVETLQTPAKTLEVGAGDCDDRATLLVALARSIGIPADFRFRVIAANPRNPRSFSHVYVVARLAGRDIPLDPTFRSNGLGYEYPGRFRVGEMPA